MSKPKDVKIMFGIAVVSQVIVVLTRGPIYIWLAYRNIVAAWEFDLVIFLMGVVSLVAMAMVNFMFIFDGTKRVAKLGSLIIRRDRKVSDSDKSSGVKEIDAVSEDWLMKKVSKTAGMMELNGDSVYGGQNFDYKDYFLNIKKRKRSKTIDLGEIRRLEKRSLSDMNVESKNRKMS